MPILAEDGQTGPILAEDCQTGVAVDFTILEIESYIENPTDNHGQYEFLSWQDSLSRIQKPSLFDANTNASFTAKSIPVFLVGCRDCKTVTLMVFDSKYYDKCVSTDRWWDTLFMRSFSLLLAHKFHKPHIKMIECTVLEKDTIRSSIKLSTDTSSVVAFLYSSNHYVVVEYSIFTKIFTVYDGLNYGVEHWISDCTNIQARCGHPPVPPCLQIGKCDSQPDSYNCGPLACLKLLHLISNGEFGCSNQIGPNKWRSYIIEYYQDMLITNSGNIFRHW